jgi:hypothetical protein
MVVEKFQFNENLMGKENLKKIQLGHVLVNFSKAILLLGKIMSFIINFFLVYRLII